MARGIPVITSDIAGIPEQLDHGVEGFVLPLPPAGEGEKDGGSGGSGASAALDPEDCFVQAMHDLANDAGLRRRMGKAGIKRAAWQHR